MEYQTKTKGIPGTASEHFIEIEFYIFQANVLWSFRWDRKGSLGDFPDDRVILYQP